MAALLAGINTGQMLVSLTVAADSSVYTVSGTSALFFFFFFIMRIKTPPRAKPELCLAEIGLFIQRPCLN